MDEKIILKGSPASAGIVEGRAKVIQSAGELAIIEKGDILVAPFTNPLFIPAMRRAVAIVTDEGGILSHAAIISREFGIPCVTGTKEGTKILRDGMKIVVDGTGGVVYEKK